MVTLQDLNQISDYEWEIPQSFRPDMQVPVRLFATRRILEEAMKDKSLEQAVNAATLPGLVGHVIVMPDMHQGYGFPIGGVAATRLPDGVISPGGIGYDINCGVRLLGSHISLEAARPWLDELATALNQFCPSGVGEKGSVHLTEAELIAVCRQGSRWALNKGFASEADLRRTEESGCVEGADPDKVSVRARQRGRPQLGSLGAGNHFIEIDLVEQVFEPQAASVMGLEAGSLAVQIHCGSRGSVTRSAPITWRNSRRRCGASASTWWTVNWYARRSARLRDRAIWGRCAARPIMPLPTASYWPTAPAKRSSRCWLAR